MKAFAEWFASDPWRNIAYMAGGIALVGWVAWQIGL